MGPKRRIRSIGDLVDNWGKQRARKNPETWGKKWIYVARVIKRHAGSTPLENVNRAWSRDYADARYADGIKSASVIQELNTVIAAWNLARGDEIIQLAVPLFEKPTQPESRQIHLTKNEAVRLLAECKSPHLLLFVELALATTGRHSAITGLTWDRVHFDRKLIDLRSPAAVGTRKKAAMVPVDQDLIDRLLEARKTATTRHVIEFAGKPVRSVKRSFEQAVIRAGFNATEVTPHVLRHTAATWMAQGGVSLWDIAGFLGHKDIAMVTKVYGHHSPDHLRGSVEALSLRDHRK